MTTITLAQVAERAGVSTATVSMVLRNRGRISQATRERVLKALDDSGYVYNQTAANLRNRSSNQVGLLLHDITNPITPAVWCSARRGKRRPRSLKRLNGVIFPLSWWFARLAIRTLILSAPIIFSGRKWQRPI